jgi:hypothetical protein
LFDSNNVVAAMQGTEDKGSGTNGTSRNLVDYSGRMLELLSQLKVRPCKFPDARALACARFF